MMQTAQLRETVIDKIYGINDVDYLNAIKKILDGRRNSDQIYYLNEKQKELINTGIQQINAGDYVTNEDLEKEEDQWLEE